MITTYRSQNVIYNLAYTYKFQLKNTQVSQEIWLTETNQFDSYKYVDGVGIFQNNLRKMRLIIWKWNTVFGISVCMMSISWASSILKNSFIFCLLPFFLLLAECSFILVVCVLFWVHALFSQKSSKKITNLTN